MLAKHAPIQNKRIKYTSQPPWFNNEIKEAINQRNKLKQSKLHPPLLMNNVPIESVRSRKHIGLTFTDDAKWKDHISSILNKA